MITYEWLTDGQIEFVINPMLEARGMAQLNINPDQPTCRVLGAWEGNTLISSFTIQMVPMLGPLLRHDNVRRDSGEISRELAEHMHQYLTEKDARSYMVIADNPLTERLCQRHEMEKISSPVYVPKDESLECNDYTSPPAKVLQ